MLEYFLNRFFYWLGELGTDLVGYYLVFLVESLMVPSMKLDEAFH